MFLAVSLLNVLQPNTILLDSTLLNFFLFSIHCYSKVSADFKGNLAPFKLRSVMKYVGMDVNYQIHEDVAW